jgi:NAD(P)-dependent dehydrogenase (short-subunit alcohol dehydrogenase family)
MSQKKQPTPGLSLSGRSAVVTGAGRGIGRAVARALAAEGAAVALAARTEGQVVEVAEAIRAAGGKAEAFRTDVSIESDVRALFEGAVRELGGVDVLVHCAGIALFGPVSSFDAADLDRVIATNLRGSFLSIREALRVMEPRKRGSIIGIASTVARKAYADHGAYGASKLGMVGLWRSAAIEAARHGIRVSTILPGATRTGIIGDARPDLEGETLLQPEDIAQVVLYLLSLPERAAVDEIEIRRSAWKG